MKIETHILTIFIKKSSQDEVTRELLSYSNYSNPGRTLAAIAFNSNLSIRRPLEDEIFFEQIEWNWFELKLK